MDTEYLDLPILNEDYENIFHKENVDEFNDSIFLANEFEEIQKAYEFDMKSESREKESQQEKQKNFRKDNFDYNAYIQEEMRNLDTSNMSETLKKHMIQKIRNRMSAQRSRQRQKNMQEFMEHENKTLKSKNKDLKKQLIVLKDENDKLKLKIKVLESSRTTDCSSEEEGSNSEISNIFRSKEEKTGFGINKTSFFLFIALIGVFLVPNGGGIENTVTKMGGIVPMISSNLPQLNKQLKTIDDMCRDYCDEKITKGQSHLAYKSQYRKERNKIQSLGHYSEKMRQIELFEKVDVNKLVCFSPEAQKENEDVYRIIVNSATFSKLNPEEVYYGEFQKLILE